jgi:CubicO group peptidase (beta-lactamase class C family)
VVSSIIRSFLARFRFLFQRLFASFQAPEEIQMGEKRFGSLLILTAFIGLTWSCAFQGQDETESEEVPRRLGQLLSTYEQYGFSGSVLVSTGGQVVFARGYGFANRESGERNTAETRFDFASIAKTFTGAAVLSLEAEGLLSVNDRLEKHLGPFPEQKSTATIRHLATHTGGLAHRSKSVLEYGQDRETYVQSMKDAPFESVPGSSYRYSNAGTSLLAAVVEEVAGKPFEVVVRERLFRPAGLTSTGFYTEFEPGSPGLARGYLDETVTPAPPEYDEWTWGAVGATGIVSTVGDIHTWFDVLYAGEILPREQAAKVFDPEETEAFGWHMETNEQGRTFIHKGGGLAAMQTQILAYPDQETVVVWAHNNMSRNWRRALNRGISSAALGDSFLLPPEITAIRKSDPDLEGWWQTEGGTLLELVDTGAGLGVGGNGFGIPEGPLRPGMDGSWVSFDVERVSTFALALNRDGSVRVELEPEGERLVLGRVEASEPAYQPLVEPTDKSLDFARQVSAWIMNGDADQTWNASVYRPVRGSYSREGWMDRFKFIAGRVGAEVRLIEEAWVLREGSWRYWRTFESRGGMEVVLRFGVSGDEKVLSYGINPRGAEPAFDEKRTVAASGQDEQ